MNENMSAKGGSAFGGKKVIIPLVAIAVVAIAVFILMQSKSNPAAPATDSTLTPPQTGRDFDPQHPNFIMGKVQKVSSSQIDFQSGPVNYSAQISPTTKLVKQVSVKGVVSVVDATLADFKTNSSIIVYFSSDPKNNVFQAEKVQIIN